MITEKVQSSVYAQYWSKNLACVSLPSDCGVGPDWYETIWSQDVPSSGSLLLRALIFLPFFFPRNCQFFLCAVANAQAAYKGVFCISVIHFGINPLLTSFLSLVNKVCLSLWRQYSITLYQICLNHQRKSILNGQNDNSFCSCCNFIWF